MVPMNNSDQHDGTERRERDKSNILERHAQTLILMVVTALVLWVGSSLTNLSEAVVRLEERMSHLSTQVKELREANATIYTRTDAERDNLRTDGRLIDLDLRVRKLEGGR